MDMCSMQEFLKPLFSLIVGSDPVSEEDRLY